jgi:hypothetical protein
VGGPDRGHLQDVTVDELDVIGPAENPHVDHLQILVDREQPPRQLV